MTPNEPEYWAGLVARVQAGEPAAVTELYERVFKGGVRFLVLRQVGPEGLEDVLHDIFVIVFEAVQRGEVREPERLIGFIRTVVERRIAGTINKRVRGRERQADIETAVRIVAANDEGSDPEERLAEIERRELGQRALDSLNARDREILTRFYLEEQSPERICADMELTETQFRLHKSRAKARFGSIGRQFLTPGALARLKRCA